MLSIMKLTDEAVAVFISNDGQEIIIMDDFSQLNEKSVKGICRVLRNPGGNTGVASNPGFSM